MPIDLTNEVHRSRLSAQVAHHYRVLDAFRLDRAKMIRDYCGSLYGDESEPRKRKILVNLMLQTAEAYTLAMAANCPRFNIAPRRDRSLRGFARHSSAALNNLVQEIHLEETMRAVILDAFFGPSFVKVCLGDSALVQIEQDVWMDPGYPYVGKISLDDWCHDTGAKDFRACQFYVDRYRVPLEKLTDSVYDQKVAKLLTATSKYGEAGSPDRASKIAHGHEIDADEVEPMIDLADVYLPALGKVCTFAVEAPMTLKALPPLAVIDWDGAETGPYRMLNLGPVPDNIMPVAPAANLKHLFDLVNSNFRKLDLSARHMKDVLLVMAGKEDDAQKVIDAPHMAVRTVKGDPKQTMHPVTFNGPSPVLQAFTMMGMQIFDRMAGNLKGRAGLGQQADTATQEGMIQGQIAESEGALALKVIRLTEELGRELLNLMFDTEMTIESSVTLPHLGQIQSDWTPEYRRGRRNDYELRVEPYSMAYQSPSQRASRLRAHAAEMMPLVQAGLVEFDVGEFNEALGRYDDMTEYSEIWTTPLTPARQQAQAGGGEMPPPMNPNKPNGKYTRVSKSGGPTGEGKDSALMQTIQSLGNAQGAA